MYNCVNNYMIYKNIFYRCVQLMQKKNVYAVLFIFTLNHSNTQQNHFKKNFIFAGTNGKDLDDATVMHSAS